jgi:hypothetical protein
MMQFDFATLLEAMRRTLQFPRETAKQILAMQLPSQVGWLGLMTAAVLSSILSVISTKMLGGELLPGYEKLVANPLVFAVSQWALLLFGVMLIVVLGRKMGGRGSFADALILAVWLEAILIAIQVAQLIVMIISPMLGFLIGVASIVVFFRVLSNFIAELHGFKSAGKVLGMVLLTFLVLSFVLALSGFGFTAEELSGV